MILIPTDSTGALREYTEVVGLEAAKYTIKLSWNTRTEHWMLSLYDTAANPVIEGAAVSCGVDLLRGSSVSTRPPGRLLAIPTDASIEHPGLKGLGSRVQLYYEEAGE
jgi:hypothetical protein